MIHSRIIAWILAIALCPMGIHGAAHAVDDNASHAERDEAGKLPMLAATSALDRLAGSGLERRAGGKARGCDALVSIDALATALRGTITELDAAPHALKSGHSLVAQQVRLQI